MTTARLGKRRRCRPNNRCFPKPRPCIKPGRPGTPFEPNPGCTDDFDHANLSWISADQAYLARDKPSPETINDIKAYEFFAGHDANGQAVWTSDYAKIKPLLEWNNHMGCVTATYVPGLKKKGPVLDFGKPGEEDSASAACGVTCSDGESWHMLMFFSASTRQPALRTLGIARSRDLDRTWTVDAEDLVQGFFAELLEQDALRLADRARGRFRTFLLASLKNHMASEWQRAHRLKRGGFATHLSIDWHHAETGLTIEPADGRSPDKLYDHDWAVAVLDKVLDDLGSEDHGLDFVLWKPFLSMGSGKVPYADIAARFGMTEGAARVAVHRLRKRYRQRLHEEIGRTLADESLVDEEMTSLFSALSG